MKTKLKTFFSPIETLDGSRYTFWNFLSTPSRIFPLLVLVAALIFSIVVGDADNNPVMTIVPILFFSCVLTVFSVMTLDNWYRLKIGKEFTIKSSYRSEPYSNKLYSKVSHHNKKCPAMDISLICLTPEKCTTAENDCGKCYAAYILWKNGNSNKKED